MNEIDFQWALEVPAYTATFDPPTDMSGLMSSRPSDRVLADLCAQVYNEASFESGVCHALCGKSINHNVIAFQGTEDGDEWIANARRWPVSTPRGAVHKGWLEALGTILPRLVHWLELSGGIRTPVLLTGHSAGGAHAGLLAGHLVAMGYQVEGVTFGQPRFCDRTYAKWLGASVPWRRYVYENDFVPHLFPLFSHVGEERWFDGRKWRDGISWGRWLLGLLRFGREHSIETYRGALA